jgi:hypothetical protein
MRITLLLSSGIILTAESDTALNPKLNVAKSISTVFGVALPKAKSIILAVLLAYPLLPAESTHFISQYASTTGDILRSIMCFVTELKVTICTFLFLSISTLLNDTVLDEKYVGEVVAKAGTHTNNINATIKILFI